MIQPLILGVKMCDNVITSKDNEKIKLYRRLYDDKKVRRSMGLFVMEGARLICDAAKEDSKLRCIFVSRSGAERYGEALELLKSRYPDRLFSMVADEASRVLSGTGSPQGLFAICEMKDPPDVRELTKEGGRYIILDGIQDPGNMGTILRTADACGIDGVFTAGCCDVYNPKVVRSAMGSLMRIRFTDGSFEEITDILREKGVPVYAAVPGEGLSLTECDFDRGGAVIIGNEGNGIPPEHSEQADKRLTIKMKGSIESLNAAMAAGIIMWELSKNKENL